MYVLYLVGGSLWKTTTRNSLLNGWMSHLQVLRSRPGMFSTIPHTVSHGCFQIIQVREVKKKKKNYIFISQKGFCAFKFELFPTFVKILWVAVFFYGNSVYLSNLYEIKHISKNFKEMFQTFRIEKSTCEIKYFHQMQSPSELFFKIKICALHILA